MIALLPEPFSPTSTFSPFWNSITIFSRDDCRFSNGNFGSHLSIISNDIDGLREFPFQKIYHLGVIDSPDGREIIFHRNAEILIPNQLDLSSLRYVVCRSEAEKETLINLLSDTAKTSWLDKIIYNPKLDIFEKRWCFVERTSQNSSHIRYYFSPDTRTPGPFRAKFIFKDLNNAEIGEYNEVEFWANQNYNFNFRNPHNYYEVKLFLDGDLANSTIFRST